MSLSTAPSFIPGDQCPCGCGVTGSKLSAKTGHIARACSCRPCIGRKNQQRGRTAQRKTHQALDGQGVSPFHEESGLFYDLTVRPEVKAGKQVGASFWKFIGSEFFRRALSQSERAIPVGIDARPAVCIDGRWLVVDLQRRELKK